MAMDNRPSGRRMFPRLDPKQTYPAFGFDFSINTAWNAMNGGLGAHVAQPRE